VYDDNLTAGTGKDSLFGGSGDDSYTISTQGFHEIFDSSGTNHLTVSDAYSDDVTYQVSGSALYISDSHGHLFGQIDGDISNFDSITYQDATVTIGSIVYQAQATSGSDTIDASSSWTSVNIDLGAGDDSFLGSSYGDTIIGGAGDDTIDGGGGTNTVDYSHDTAAVTVDLSSGTATDGYGDTDTLSNIQVVIGSHFDDTITGDGTSTVVSYQDAANAVVVDLSSGTATGDGSDTLTDVVGVIGSAFNDVIEGDSGDNTLDGGAGIDAVSYAAASSAVTVNLSTGTATGDGNDTLTNFENVIGSSHNDSLTGDSHDNVFVGGAGNDTIDGGSGTNTLDYSQSTGGITLDVYSHTVSDGYGGTDTFSNIQIVDSSHHNDSFTGYSPIPVTVSYEHAANAVTVDLGSGTATGDGSDSFSGITDIIGSDFNDVIAGGAYNNHLYGGAGNDTLRGDYGNDTLDGGSGVNTADYSQDSAGITADLSTGSATDGYSTTDTLINIQNILGSDYADTITGDSNDNVLNGGKGNDTIHGGAGNDDLIGGWGNDTLDGGTGTNTADYSADGSGIYVDLSSGTATDGHGNSDTLSNIQNVTGSAYADAITGDSHDNVLLGSGGNDTLVGGDGNDTLDGGSGENTADYSNDTGAISVDLTAGTATDGFGGTDILVNISDIQGSAYADTIKGDSNDNLLHGNGGDDTFISTAGNDYYFGGTGTNTVDFSNDPAGITADLAGSSATGGWGNSDYLGDIQNIIGSAYDDKILANGSDNVIDGGGGNNTVSYESVFTSLTINLSTGTVTGGSNDTLTNVQNIIGSLYADSITGDSHDNILAGFGGNDTINGGGGFNTVDYSHDGGSVTVNLSTGHATDAWSGVDTLSNIQAVIGSHYNDTLTGDGSSTISYQTATTGVTVNLSSGTASGDGSDTLSGFVNVIGSSHADTITGDSGANSLYGNGGADSLTGGSGADTFIFKAITAMTASVDVTDFNTAQSDKIDLTDLLAGHYDPVHDAITDFVSLSTSGSDTHLLVDLDGTGSAHSPVQIASILGVTGLNVSIMISNGELVVPT